MKKVVIIGAGIGGLSAASVLAQKGYAVTVIEKNDKPGGRINFFEAEGFKFDMGPSWYWMPEVFDNFYELFGHKREEFYDLIRLDPSYKVVFREEDIDMPADYKALRQLFESRDKGSGARLDKFLNNAAYKYEVGMNEYVWKPGRSLTEFLDLRVLKSFMKMQMLSSISSAVKKVTQDSQLQSILEFPVLFLGATPQETPALYSLMNYADLKLGTWYPAGGMYKIAEAFYKIALNQGVQFRFSEEVNQIDLQKDKISKVFSELGEYECDYVICNADYHHMDQKIVPKSHSHYTKKYWDTRKLAPSSLLVYLGLDSRVDGLEHHNLFFDADFKEHAVEIYKDPKWPRDPLFYVCCPSISDTSVAPEGKENLFVLMPIATDLKDDPEIHEQYLATFINRIKLLTGNDISKSIIYKRFFSVRDFKSTYNSLRGNAYGLSNTLDQTAILKPSMKSKKISNLFYAGQLTTPGPGLPPSIISGQVAAAELIKQDVRTLS